MCADLVLVAILVKNDPAHNFEDLPPTQRCVAACIVKGVRFEALQFSSSKQNYPIRVGGRESLHGCFEEELLQVESYLRVAKHLLWRQEELELMETRKRGKHNAHGEGPGRALQKKKYVHETLVCLLCKAQVWRTFEKCSPRSSKALRGTATR